MIPISIKADSKAIFLFEIPSFFEKYMNNKKAKNKDITE